MTDENPLALLSPHQRELFGAASQIVVGYTAGLMSVGLAAKPCVFFWTADLGWDSPLKLCACETWPAIRVATTE